MSDEEKPKRQRAVPRNAKGERVPPKKLISYARMLLSQNMTPGDIKRQMSETYGLKGRSFERYIAKARELNREHLRRSADECKSDSVAFWANKLQQCERNISRDYARLQDAHGRLDDANSVLADDDELAERKEQAQMISDRCVKEIDGLKRSIYSNQHDSFLCQQWLDKLLGNLAPAKVAHTDTAGNDVLPPAAVCAIEPTTVEYAESVVQQVLATLEPLGLYLVDRGGHRIRQDGTFEGQTIIEAPPAPPPAQPTPRLPGPQMNYDRSVNDECE
jgi:hypothetical protein